MEKYVERWGHELGYDPVFYALRKKIYPETELQHVISDVDGRILTEFCVLSEISSGIRYKCLSTPSSYFSSSLRSTSKWSDNDWNTLSNAIRRKRGWDICRFTMLSDSELAQIKRVSIKKLLSYSVHQDQFRMIPGDLSFTEYQATRSASFNRNQRRCQRLVEKAGFPTTHEMTIEEILSTYDRRHSQRDEEDYSVTAQFKTFLTQLRETMQTEGRWYEVGIRNEQGELAAFALGFWDHNKVFYLFQTAHDPQYRSLRLGGVVFERLIEDILTRGCSYLSFASDASYLQSYSDRVYKFNRIDIYGQTPRGFLLLLIHLSVNVKKMYKSLLAQSRLEAPISPSTEGAVSA